jgi:hypothetical protein
MGSVPYDARRLNRRERLTFSALAALAVVMRIVALLHYRFDADEQHHMHVVWGWTDGLVQYRDTFDNHAPLFHLLMAPILGLFTAFFGERSDVLLWMRLPMLVPFAVVLWATYTIARRLYDERIARWSALLLALFPPYFLKSLEVRTDNLWTMLWMLTLVALLNERWPAKRRMFIVGLLLGCALAVSLKTSLLVITLLVAALLTRLFVRRVSAPLHYALLGFIIVPTALLIYFAAVGAWHELIYCTLTFNGNVALTRKNLWVGRATFPFTFAAVVWLAWRFRQTQDAWRYFLAVCIGVFAVTLAGFWILISPRDFLPLMPLGAIFAAAAASRSRNPERTFAIVGVLLAGALWHYADRFENRTDWHTTMMDQALRLTRPGEPLIDLKGETIYRRRPFYYAFESITRAQIAHGLIRDTLQQDVIRTRTHVAQADGPMWPSRGRAFLNENFVNLGRLRASGQWLAEDGTFTIAVPGEYVIVSEHGEARGMLDGTPYTGARPLASGAHRFVGRKKVVALWAPAFRRGHSPFHLRDLDF